MKKSKILIVEDELIIAQDISIRLQNIGYKISNIAGSAEEALVALKKEQPDLCVIDIELGKDMDGITLAHKIKDQYNIPILFLTSSRDALTIARAREAKPAAYILKPFSDHELQITIDLVISNFYNQNEFKVSKVKNESVNGDLLFLNDSIFIRKKERFYKVDYANILWVEANSNYSTIVTAKEKYTVSITLSLVGQKFISSLFVRANRSYIINMAKIDAIDGNLLFINGNAIPVSKGNKENVFKCFNML